MKEMPLTMLRQHLCNIPEYSLPDGFRIECFLEGDEKYWAEIETKAGEFENTDVALERFYNEFGSNMESMSKRCLFMENKHGEKIGTATAWYGSLDGNNEEIGRIHWVGIIPQYQGKKLSKPLLSAALNQLALYHTKAYLTSQTTSFQAINMYLNYGFEPYLKAPESYEVWSIMEDILSRKIL